MIQIHAAVCERPYATPTLETLRQNTTPDSNTRCEIEEILQKDNANISFLDEEISKLQLAILDLERQRQTIQTRVDRNKAFLAPIRRIPVEILQQIFTLCFPFVATTNIKWLPFQVGPVSAHWKYVASTTPELWNKIELTVVATSGYTITMEGLCICHRFVSLAHSRSGTRPITMTMAPDLTRFSPIVSIVKQIASKFCGHWAELSIDIDLFNLVGKDVVLPAVKHLTLSDKLQKYPPHCRLPHRMTHLTHLKLVRCSAPVIRLINMPWSQITHFEALFVPITDLIATLGQMSTLTHAHVAPTRPVGSYDAPGLQAICLLHLRDLSLSCSEALICDVVKSLTTPILSGFRVIVSGDSSSLDAPQLQSLGKTLRAFIDRSAPPITHLGLQHVSAEDMKDTFEGLATVESLDLSVPLWYSHALNLIVNQLVWRTQPDGSPELDITNLLPNLQMLTVRRTNLDGALPGVIQMICSRLKSHITSRVHPPPSRLRRISFRSEHSMSSLDQIRHLGVAVDYMHELCAPNLEQLDIDVDIH